MLTVHVTRPGRESRTSVPTLTAALTLASEVIVLSRGETIEISIVDEETREEVSNYFSPDWSAR